MLISAGRTLRSMRATALVAALLASILGCAHTATCLPASNASGARASYGAGLTPDQEKTAGTNAALRKALGDADKSVADAEKAQRDNTFGWIQSAITTVNSATSALLTLLGLGVLLYALPAILRAVKSGTATLMIPMIGSITLQRNAALQQMRSSPPPLPTDFASGGPSAERDQLQAAKLLRDVISSQAGAQGIVDAAKASSTDLVDLAHAVAGITPESDDYFRTFFRNLFTSQYLLLASLAGGSHVDISLAHSDFARAQLRGLTTLTFGNWLGYLERYEMIKPYDLLDPASKLEATSLAVAFMNWSRSTRHGIAELRMAGLDY